MEKIAKVNSIKRDTNKIEHNADEATAAKSNSKNHSENGNKSHYKILQLNSSNSDFNSKLHELRSR